MSDFNPNDIGVANGNYFGLPCNEEESDIVLLSVPWEATVSYGKGTADGPQAIIDADFGLFAKLEVRERGITLAGNIRFASLSESFVI